MDIIEFEKEVMSLFGEHYNDTEKLNDKNWFKIKTTSLYKEKVGEIFFDSKKEAFVKGVANNYNDLFIGMLYQIREYLLENPYRNILCSSCKGRGEFEISAGSHSIFEDCNKCAGTGKANE